MLNVLVQLHSHQHLLGSQLIRNLSETFTSYRLFLIRTAVGKLQATLV